MEIIRKKAREKHKNEALIAFEYPTKDKDINGAVTNIKGRYPKEGWLYNEVCKELIYVLQGSGKLFLQKKSVTFKAGDVIILKPKEKYYWQGQMTHLVATTPPWYPEQHKHSDT